MFGISKLKKQVSALTTLLNESLCQLDDNLGEIRSLRDQLKMLESANQNRHERSWEKFEQGTGRLLLNIEQGAQFRSKAAAEELLKHFGLQTEVLITSIELNNGSSANDGLHVKLSFEVAEVIRERYAVGDVTMKTLAAEYGVTPSTISRIIHNLAWVAEDE